jgi:hypothetical protein
MARKRAPGGGRRPQGEFAGKSVTFATRLTPITRRALEQAAKASGRSLSQEAESRLSLSLQKPQGKPHNRALAFAVATLANRIEEETGRSWREDPFTGTALRYAVEMLLTLSSPEFVPDPEIPPAVQRAAAKMPPDFSERYLKPAGFGHSLAYNLTNEIEQARMQSKPAKSLEKFHEIFNEWSLPMLAVIARDLDQKDDDNG